MNKYKISFQSNLGIEITVQFKADSPIELQKKIAEYQKAFPKEARHLISINEI